MSCGIIKTTSSKTLSYEEVLDKFYKVHGNRYDYSQVNYINNHSKVKIICKLHGEFHQAPKSHITGSNCPNCGVKVSKPELDILAYIRTKYQGEVIQSFRPTWLDGKELDIFIPEFNLAIEYNGSSFHHSSKSTYVNKYYRNTYKSNSYHMHKWKQCFDNNITLLSIYDFYWTIPSKRENYLSKINHYLHLDRKIYSRKCELLEIDNSLAFSFYENNHIEGKGFAYKDSRSFGLFYNKELVMCSTIGYIYNQQSKTFKLKLHRIATLKCTTVVGGVSKLSKFLKNNIGSFSYQITLSSGGSTLKYFKNNKIIPPRYFWVNPNTLEYFHRNFCQKHLLQKHFKQPLLLTDTESIYMERLGYLKVYDNGLAELQI